MKRSSNSRNCMIKFVPSATFFSGFNSVITVLVLCCTFCSSLHAQTSTYAAPSELTTQPKTWTLKSSQTLDKVIQEVYKDSPLSYSILRNAMLKANPLILSGNPAQRIKVGLTLTIPDHSQLVMNTLTTFISENEGSDKLNKSYSSDSSYRRNWVRFP
jgi:hypothetical protein